MILYAYSEMLEFPGQILEISMPVGRGTRGPLSHLWVQAWTDNDYLNLRSLLRDLYDIMSSSGRSPDELFLRSEKLSGGSLSVRLCVFKHFFLSHLLQDHWSDFIFNFVRLFPTVSSRASTKTNSGPSTNMAAFGHL